MRFVDKRSAVIREGELFISKLVGDVYILGTNHYGLSLALWLQRRGHNFVGFVNDFLPDDEFAGFKVYRSDECSEGAAIINCIVEGRSIDGLRTIGKMGLKNQISYFSLHAAFKDELPEIQFLDDTQSIGEALDGYKWVFELLDDDTSRSHFESITNFRFNRDISFLESFEFNIKGQYFEDFLELGEKPTFVDGGGFDGFTSGLFSKIYPDYSEIYCFEPSQGSFETARENLKDLVNVQVVKKGLWDTPTKLTFDATLGSASKISTDGMITIETTTIDEIGAGKVDFIKLDVEGAERRALLGAKETILRDKPSIAVCVYHNQSDFVEIPKLVLGIRSDYRVFLRHYTQGVFETVMYFI